MHTALFIGRFQPFHNAHLADIKKILGENDFVVIAIGSSQHHSTRENPFSYSERKKMIELALKAGRIKNFRIFPVPDMYNDRLWVEYITYRLPHFDVVYSGNAWTLKCFRKFGYKNKKIKLLKGISSTIVRDHITREKEWKKLVPGEIHNFIKKIKGEERIRFA